MSVRDRLSQLAELLRVEPDSVVEPLVTTGPARAEFPCGVPTCYADTSEIERDEKWIVVGCVDHNAQTRWEHTARTVEPLNIIKPDWKRYGTGVR